jgi:hypothetical protein
MYFLVLSWLGDMIPRMSPIAWASLLQSVVPDFLNKQIRQDPGPLADILPRSYSNCPRNEDNFSLSVLSEDSGF